MSSETVDGGKKETLSFILPVLNRKQFIVRAIENCLACESDHVEPYVLVIEGGSNDGTVEVIQEKFSDNPRVKLIHQHQDRAGFMNSCYIGVENLPDGLATFMYSDDLVSPWFVRLADALVESPDISLALGYGEQAKEDEIIDFMPITVERISAESVLDAFYGRGDRLDGRTMPVNPICCVGRSSTLREWMDYVQIFTAGHPLREYSMIRLAGGPDLMFYLLSLFKSGKEVLHSKEVVGQFTASKDSISVQGNQEIQLTVGYWLGRVWGFTQMAKGGKKHLVGKMGGYLVTVWFFILLTKIRRRERNWYKELVDEFKGVIHTLRDNHQIVSALIAGFGNVAARFRMKN